MATTRRSASQDFTFGTRNLAALPRLQCRGFGGPIAAEARTLAPAISKFANQTANAWRVCPCFGDEIRFSLVPSMSLTLNRAWKWCKSHIKSCTSAISSRQKPIFSASMISTTFSDLWNHSCSIWLSLFYLVSFILLEFLLR